MLADDKSLIYANAPAIVAGLGCAATFYVAQEEKDNKAYAIAATICAVAAYCAIEGDRQLLGSLNCVLCVALLASPLATLKTVIETKSTNSLPFWTSVNTWCNGLAWSLFGLLVMNDPFVSEQNYPNYVLIGNFNMDTALLYCVHVLGLWAKYVRICVCNGTDVSICNLWFAGQDEDAKRNVLIAAGRMSCRLMFNKHTLQLLANMN